MPGKRKKLTTVTNCRVSAHPSSLLSYTFLSYPCWKLNTWEQRDELIKCFLLSPCISVLSGCNLRETSRGVRGPGERWGGGGALDMQCFAFGKNEHFHFECLIFYIFSLQLSSYYLGFVLLCTAGPVRRERMSSTMLLILFFHAE